MLRAIRGATTIEENTAMAIAQRTQELLQMILSENKLTPEEVIQVTFSATQDITQAYPAKYAREVGFAYVPMFCVQEMHVEGSLPLCIRALCLVDQDDPVKHIYLHQAKSLRPDLN